MSSYVVGVDAGATKTSACAFNRDGRLLMEVRKGPGNFVENEQEAAAHVMEAVSACIETLGSGCQGIAIGAAGMGSSGMAATVENNLESVFQCQVKAGDDGWLALHANLQNRNGILVIAGTGSVVYVKSDAGCIRLGGWGYLLDDRGSATAIALESLRRMVRTFDEGKSLSPLEMEILKRLECSDIWKLPQAVHGMPKAELAALASLVGEYADAEDPEACSILTWAGEELAHMVCLAAKRAGLMSPAIAVSGSVFKKNRWVEQTFWEKVKRELPKAERCPVQHRAEKGALWICQ